ncbi:MAG: ABC transporter permease [Bacteroidetes bacterium]|nr:ABC transporter permease [Fibrella sp.]
MILLSTFVSDVFFSQTNLSNLFRQVSGVGLVSMGLLLVIMVGGIDLSVGSVMSLGGVLLALLTHQMPLGAALTLTIGCGIALGLTAGFLTTAGKIAPFIATLALMTIARGVSFMVSDGSPVPLNSAAAPLLGFGDGYLLGVPYPVLFFLLITGLVFVMLQYNVIGRILIAIGSNEEAVRLAGINVNRYYWFVYAFSGAMASLAGIITVARTGIGSPVVGIGLELDAIAAVVVGGASLKGGRGSAINTLLGVIILGMIGNIMNLKDVPAYPQQIIKGVIIILAVLLQRFQK